MCGSYTIDFVLIRFLADHTGFNLGPVRPPVRPIGLTGALIRSYRIFRPGWTDL